MKDAERIRLEQMARARNDTLWCDLDYAGLLLPVKPLEHLYNELRVPIIEDFLIIADDVWRVKEITLERETELDLLGIAQDKQIANLKVALGYEKLAITRAIAEYKLAVRRFAAQVKDALMAARELAAAVDVQNLAIDGRRLQLEINKELLHQEKVAIEIQEEQVNQKMTQAEVAKYQVEVAKAQIRVAEAQVQVVETQVQVLETNVEVTMTLIEQVELAARVAMILADIAKTGIAAVRLAAETIELDDRMEAVNIKSAAQLALDQQRLAVQYVILAGVNAIINAIPSLTATEIAGEQIQITEADSQEAILEHKEAVVQSTLNQEQEIETVLLESKEAMDDERLRVAILEKNAETAARIMINLAHQWAAKNMQEYSLTNLGESGVSTRIVKEELTISSGS